MIAELLLIAAAGIIDPMDMSGHTMYPSGVKECDKYMYALPENKHAKLSLGHNIVASDGRIIKGGHYLVSLSVSGNEILFFEGEKELYSVKVDLIEILDKPIKLSTAVFLSDDNGVSFVILKQGKYKVTAKVNIDDENR